MAQQITTSDRNRITSIVNRMGSAMARIAAERGHCLDLDLIDEGFDPEEIHLHATAARAVAARQL